MDKNTETEKVLWELFIQRCDEETGVEHSSDEYCVLSYNYLIPALNLEKTQIQSIIKELRNSGFVKLEMAWNESEGYFCGSGWAITDKGILECRSIFKNEFKNHE